jgi:predicted metal-dependent phosphoesterase TrpH
VIAGPPGAPRFVDLHCHSTASDGTAAPGAVAAAAAAAAVSALALTDHDSVDGVAEARRAGGELGIDIIAGVELSAFENDRETHILGLHLAALDALNAQLATFRSARRLRAERIVAALNTLGVPVTLDAVLREAGAGAIGRPHIARALIAGGWVRDLREAFDRYLGFRKPAFVPKQTLGVADAIRLIHAAGGIAVLAHPGADGVRAWLEPLAALGMDGVEVRHPSHSAEDIARLGALTDHLGLVPSGGSDWHGATTGPRLLNSMRVPYDWLERQRERAAAHAARARVA